METLEGVSPHDKDTHNLVAPTMIYIFTTLALSFPPNARLALSPPVSSSFAKKYPSISSLLSMESANVISSMYEGGSKRSMGREEQEENSSKSARARVKERTNGFKARNDISNISNNRTMMTRSMSMKTTEKKDEKLVMLEVIDLDEEEDDNVNDTNYKATEEQQQQPAVNEVVEKEGEDDVAMLTLDDWPLPWCSEEAFSWCNGYVCGWYSYWDVMGGDHWLPRADSVEAAWRDDQWICKNNSESPKP